MSSSLEQQLRVFPLDPAHDDLADLWLDRALANVQAAYEAEPERLEACRLAVVFAALAVEARLNRLLQGCGAAAWPVVERLAPVEKLRLAPRLLGVPDPGPRHRSLLDGAVKLFELRGELVDDAHRGAEAEAPRHLHASAARTSVEVSADICTFLTALAAEGEDRTARYVHDQARILHPPARPVPAAEPGSSVGGGDEFPPDVVGS